MTASAEFGDLVPVTMTYPGNGKAYDTPFDVNVYGFGDSEIEGDLGAYIGPATVRGLEVDEENPDDGGASILEIDDGTGRKIRCPSFFFEIVPIDADTHLTPETLRISYADYMSQTPEQTS